LTNSSRTIVVRLLAPVGTEKADAVTAGNTRQPRGKKRDETSSKKCDWKKKTSTAKTTENQGPPAEQKPARTKRERREERRQKNSSDQEKIPICQGELVILGGVKDAGSRQDEAKEKCEDGPPLSRFRKKVAERENPSYLARREARIEKRKETTNGDLKTFLCQPRRRTLAQDKAK